MKKLRILLAILLFVSHQAVMSNNHVLDTEQLSKIESTTLRPFFTALQTGDVESIKRCFTEQKSQVTGLLGLEGDALKEYANELRTKYEGAIFSVESGSVSAEQVIVDVKFDFPDGGWIAKQYYLEEQVDAIEGGVKWLIADERMK